MSDILSGPSACLIYGKPSSYQLPVAYRQIARATANNGVIIFVGRSAWDSDRELRRYFKFMDWKNENRRVITAGLDLTDYQKDFALFLQDVKAICAGHAMPYILFHDASGHLDGNNEIWWQHVAHARRNFLACRIVTCASFAGDPPRHIVCDQKIKVESQGYNLSVSENDTVEKFVVRPFRGALRITPEAAHA